MFTSFVKPKSAFLFIYLGFLLFKLLNYHTLNCKEVNEINLLMLFYIIHKPSWVIKT